ncbi:MAG: ribosomal protein [Pseudomonadota bacterium]
MANHKSALKRARQNEKRRLRNRAGRSAVRTTVKNLRTAIDAGSADNASLAGAMEIVAGAGAKGVIPKKRASRMISRLAKAMHKAQTQG